MIVLTARNIWHYLNRFDFLSYTAWGRSVAVMFVTQLLASPSSVVFVVLPSSGMLRLILLSLLVLPSSGL